MRSEFMEYLRSVKGVGGMQMASQLPPSNVGPNYPAFGVGAGVLNLLPGMLPPVGEAMSQREPLPVQNQSQMGGGLNQSADLLSRL